MNNKKISVIMSVFNGEHTLEESIESILNQTYSNFEFLIVDDLSDDKTYQILENYKNKDSRIRVFKNKENIGLTKSLNILLKQSKGFYIARQDADDISAEDRFYKQLDRLNKTNRQCVTTRAYINQNNRKKIPGFSSYLPNKLVSKYKNPFIHGTLLIESSLFKDLDGYDERFKYAQDYKLFLDLIEKGIKIETIKEPLYFLNTENNISNNFKSEQNYYFYCAKNGVIPKY